jgi:peptide subunit release factor 1 (eRF1)
MITVHVPKGSQAPDLNREISSARNIQDKTNRQNTLVGLRTISKYI